MSHLAGTDTAADSDTGEEAHEHWERKADNQMIPRIVDINT